MNLLNYFVYVAVTLVLTSAGTQVLKKYFRAITVRKFSLKSFTQDGGFPSSHTAFSVSWAVITIFTFFYLYLNNVSTEMLLLSAVIATVTIGNTCIIIRDALGVRRTVQILCDAVKKGAKINSEFFGSINIESVKNEATLKIQSNFEDIAKKMNIKSGHLPHEVIGGICWGAFVTGFTSSVYFNFELFKILFLIAIILYIFCISIFIKYSSSILELKLVKKAIEIFKNFSTKSF